MIKDFSVSIICKDSTFKFADQKTIANSWLYQKIAFLFIYYDLNIFDDVNS